MKRETVSNKKVDNTHNINCEYPWVSKRLIAKAKSLSLIAIALVILISFNLLNSCRKGIDAPVNSDRKVEFSFVEKPVDYQLKEAVITDARAVLVTVEQAGKTVVNAQKLTLVEFNGKFLSQTIILKEGEYTLTHFEVLNKNNEVIFVAPRTGGRYSNYVDKKLPFNFTVAKDAVTKVTPEVITTDCQCEATDFGYSSFKFTLVDYVCIRMNAEAYNIANKNWEIVPVHAKVFYKDGNNPEVVIFEKDMPATVDSITFKKTTPNFTVLFTKDGYNDQTFEFADMKLVEQYRQTPLKVTLESAKPNIVPPPALTLIFAYDAISTGEFKFGGKQPITVSQKAGANALLVYNQTTKKIDIGAGLPLGVYPVTLIANNETNQPVEAVYNVTVDGKAPTFTAPEATNLIFGYAETFTQSFTATGKPMPKVTKTAGDAKITWDADKNSLKIATGLTVGSYTVTLKATNGVGADATVTYTINVKATIGMSYQGGKIAYVDGTGLHGLIAADTDLSTGIQWGGTGTTTNATADGTIGAGKTNTDKIIAVLGAGSYVAKLCADYRGGGYADWYLPSKYELNLLYQQKASVGGFASAWYWSSTEYDTSNAWVQNFGDGTQSYYANKVVNTFYVRAVRAF